MRVFNDNVFRVSSDEWDHKKEKRLLRHATTGGKAGPSTVIYIYIYYFFLITVQPEYCKELGKIRALSRSPAYLRVGTTNSLG